MQSTLRSKVREAATRIRTGEGPPSPVDLIPSDSALHRVTSRGDTNIVAGGHRPSAPEDESSPGLSDEPTATGIQADGKTTSKGDDDINGRGGDKVEERQASRALHPTTNAGKDAVANEHKPVATTSEGKTHQHHADPTDGKDMVIDIDGEKATIVSGRLWTARALARDGACRTETDARTRVRSTAPSLLPARSNPTVRDKRAAAASVRVPVLGLPWRPLSDPGDCERQGAPPR